MPSKTEPTTLWLERRQLDLKDWKQRAPAEADVSTVITESSLIYDKTTNELALVYLELDDDFGPVLDALDFIHFEPNARSNGIATLSRVFGNMPRALPRRDFCTATSLAREAPAAHHLICSYADRVGAYYQQYNPDRFDKHLGMTDKVLPEWKLEHSAFTSGIINKNNPLLYHLDAGNFQNVWSNMLVFRRDTAGGYLALPEYDIAFSLPNNSLIMFDGQQLVHGVTPIEQQRANGVRYSIVYYSLKQMWNCLPINDEIVRARRQRLEREERRAAGIKKITRDEVARGA